MKTDIKGWLAGTMNESQLVKIISELPAGKLVGLQLALSVSYQRCEANEPHAKILIEWADRINSALEMKRADYWTPYDQVDDNPIGI